MNTRIQILVCLKLSKRKKTYTHIHNSDKEGIAKKYKSSIERSLWVSKEEWSLFLLKGRKWECIPLVFELSFEGWREIKWLQKEERAWRQKVKGDLQWMVGHQRRSEIYVCVCWKGKWGIFPKKSQFQEDNDWLLGRVILPKIDYIKYVNVRVEFELETEI